MEQSVGSVLQEALKDKKKYYGFNLTTGKFGQYSNKEKIVYKKNNKSYIGGVGLDESFDIEELRALVNLKTDRAPNSTLIQKLIDLEEHQWDNLLKLLTMDYTGL